jgi:hypothetical protein
MAKKINKDSPIALEIVEYEEKIREFQNYLKKNPIVSTIRKGGDIQEEPESQDKRHKEIAVQIKVMDALPAWLLALKKLREEQAENELETRGDVDVPGMFKNR